MSAEQGKTLLAIARAAIAATLGRTVQADESALWLRQPGATFITLTQRGELRGCIGSLEPRRTLLEDVKANACSAAFQDPRFAPLTAAEFDITRLEISLLSPCQKIEFRSEQDALAQLRPMIDGVVFEYKHHRSTFLPQVWEQLPDKEDFMGHLKLKSGLPPGFWDDELKLSRYTVEKWKETP